MSTEESRRKYWYCLQFDDSGGWWLIHERISEDDVHDPVVFRLAYDENEGGEEPPAALRAEYERLIGYVPGELLGEPQNIVELLDDEEGSGFNQKCAHGYLVCGHSVYCHNVTWLYAPRKCRRTWYTGGETRDEDCPGYSPRNPPTAPQAAVSESDDSWTKG